MSRPEPKYKGDPLVEAYDEGYQAFFDKKSEDDNPHRPSGHERDFG